MPNLDGIVAAVGGNSISIKTELGEVMVLPRQFGESPKVGTAVSIDLSTGAPKVYHTPPITEVEKPTDFLNFYAIEGESTVPKTADDKGKTSFRKKESAIYGPQVPYSFMDLPVGSRSISANNGNVVFAGPTAAGMAVGCDNKLIVRFNGAMEMVTSHLISLQGRTVIVSSFRDNLSVEIDILNSDAPGGANFDAIKTKAVSDMEGTPSTVAEDGTMNTDGVDPKTYEESFDAQVENGDTEHGAFLKMFGLHIAEILTSVRWERLRFRGDQKTFNEAFDGIAEFKNYIGYCNECYESGSIKEMEFFVSLSSENPDTETVSVRIPRCETQVVDTIYPITAVINGEDYNVDAMNIVMSSGVKIEYVAKKRVYALSHGIITKKSFTSSDQQATYSNALHLDVDKISFANLNFDNNVPDYCGNSVGLPSINWNGDFLLSVSGSMSLGSVGDAAFVSSISAILAGGTRGIKIDSSGSTAITF